MRWIIGDTETTGFPPNASVCELAFMEIDEDLNVLTASRSLIDPECHIPAGASAVHGITDQDVEGSPTLAEYVSTFGWDQIEGAILIAHNAPFDIQFLQPYVPFVGTLCTLRLARDFIKDADNHKLQTLKFHLGLEADVEHHEAHTALADVKVTLELLRYLALSTGMTLGEMVTYCQTPRQITHWPFGKHKGKPLDHDMSYVRWALKNMTNMDADLRASLEALR